jgi:hypothetical protein
MKLTAASEALKLIEKYYPKNMIKPATKVLIEELFD